MRQRDGLVSGAMAIVRIAAVLNRVFLVAVLAGLAATWLTPGFFAALLRSSHDGASGPHGMTMLRLYLVVGIAMSVAIGRLLSPLAGIIATARDGDPFVRDNVGRLRTAGWALLFLQLLDIPCGVLSWFWTGAGGGGPGIDVSASGWLATLMVFLLSRVFASGAAMRDEVQGLV